MKKKQRFQRHYETHMGEIKPERQEVAKDFEGFSIFHIFPLIYFNLLVLFFLSILKF